VTKPRWFYVALGAAFLAGYFALGEFVSFQPPAAFDLGELGTYGKLVPLAAFLRSAGQFPVYATICIVALVFGLVRRAWLAAAVTLAIELIFVWKVSDALKELFHRSRPEAWLVVRESSPSYASGHATLSLACYGFIAYVAWTSTLPKSAKVAIVAACTSVVLAIGWSRLALGAHFPSDVLGGYALGAAALCFAIAFYHPAGLPASTPRGDRALHAFQKTRRL